jgi:hypothetical protein
MIRTMHGVLYSEIMPRGGPEVLMGMEEEDYAAGYSKARLESFARCVIHSTRFYLEVAAYRKCWRSTKMSCGNVRTKGTHVLSSALSRRRVSRYEPSTRSR